MSKKRKPDPIVLWDGEPADAADAAALVSENIKNLSHVRMEEDTEENRAWFAQLCSKRMNVTPIPAKSPEDIALFSADITAWHIFLGHWYDEALRKNMKQMLIMAAITPVTLEFLTDDMPSEDRAQVIEAALGYHDQAIVFVPFGYITEELCVKAVSARPKAVAFLAPVYTDEPLLCRCVREVPRCLPYIAMPTSTIVVEAINATSTMHHLREVVNLLPMVDDTILLALFRHPLLRQTPEIKLSTAVMVLSRKRELYVQELERLTADIRQEGWDLVEIVEEAIHMEVIPYRIKKSVDAIMCDETPENPLKWRVKPRVRQADGDEEFQRIYPTAEPWALPDEVATDGFGLRKPLTGLELYKLYYGHAPEMQDPFKKKVNAKKYAKFCLKLEYGGGIGFLYHAAMLCLLSDVPPQFSVITGFELKSLPKRAALQEAQDIWNACPSAALKGGAHYAYDGAHYAYATFMEDWGERGCSVIVSDDRDSGEYNLLGVLKMPVNGYIRFSLTFRMEAEAGPLEMAELKAGLLGNLCAWHAYKLRGPIKYCKDKVCSSPTIVAQINDMFRTDRKDGYDDLPLTPMDCIGMKEGYDLSDVADLIENGPAVLGAGPTPWFYGHVSDSLYLAASMTTGLCGATADERRKNMLVMSQYWSAVSPDPDEESED